MLRTSTEKQGRKEMIDITVHAGVGMHASCLHATACTQFTSSYSIQSPQSNHEPCDCLAFAVLYLALGAFKGRDITHPQRVCRAFANVSAGNSSFLLEACRTYTSGNFCSFNLVARHLGLHGSLPLLSHDQNACPSIQEIRSGREDFAAVQVHRE